MDNLTKPGSPAGGSESNSNQTSRSNPVCLEVLVTIRSLPGEKSDASSGSAKPTREEARTVIVFDNGAVLRLSGNYPRGESVILSNPQGRDVVCRVVSTRNLPTVKGYIEVEFLEPITDFWNIHKPVGPPNVSTPTATVFAPPQGVTQMQVVPREPPIVPPAPVRVTPPVTDVTAPVAIAPSVGIIAAQARISPPLIEPSKEPESALRIPVLRKPDEPTRDALDAARPYSSTITPGSTAELTSLSATWERTPAHARKPSTSAEILGKFSSPYTASESSSGGSRAKTPLIIAGAAVFLIGVSTGLFFMHRANTPAPVPLRAAAVTQPAVPDPSVTTSGPISSPAAQPAEEPVLPLTPAVLPSEPVTREIQTVSTPAATSPVRHQATKVTPKKPDHVNVTPPTSLPQPPQLIHDLKMTAPTVESGSGRLVDASVPAIEDATATGTAKGALAGGLLSTVSHTDNPPEPPALFPSAGSISKTTFEPKLISSTPPVYPPQAKQANVEGDVLVVAEIDLNGMVIAAKAASGPVPLRQAAMDAVRNWKYEPASMDGRKTSVKTTVKIQFRLK